MTLRVKESSVFADNDTVRFHSLDLGAEGFILPWQTIRQNSNIAARFIPILRG